MLPLLPIIMGLGGILSHASKGSADQRASENSQAAQRNNLLAMLYNTRQNATSNALANSSREHLDMADTDRARKRFALTAPSVRGSQAVQGSILKNAQPFAVSGLSPRVQAAIPQISGGLTPAMFDGN